jgi:hypothetical protein
MNRSGGIGVATLSEKKALKVADIYSAVSRFNYLDGTVVYGTGILNILYVCRVE